MTCSFFTDQNFIDADFINVAYASSENAQFPSSNLYGRQQRSKVWRSNGFYKIDSSNNTLTFRETIAVDLVATLNVGDYSSFDALATEIKTALELVGGSTYTVSINSTTGKWQVVSNGAGGGGIFEIIWTDVGSQGLADVLGFSVTSDDTGGLTYSADYISIHTEEYLLWDFGLPSLPQAFYAFADRNSPIPLSNTATIILEGNHTDNFSTAVYSQAIPYDDRNLNFVSSAGLGSTYLRYWRLKIVDSQNGNGFVQLGYIHLGSILEPSRGRISFGLSGNYVDFSDTVRVVGGQIYANNRAKTESFSFAWEKLTKEDKELFDAHFDDKGKTKAFVVSLDPDTAISSNSNVFTRLVKYASEPSWQIVSPNNYTVQMVLEEAL